MMKIIKEKELKKIVSESVKKVLKEYFLADSDELMEYMWLKPHLTRLNVDIFVDDGEAYIRNGHSLLLFARNGYDKTVNEFITFEINDEAPILNPSIEYKIIYDDIFAIQNFIIFNRESLKLLANGKISQIDFVKGLKTNYGIVAENKMLLSEMSTLKAKDSGLPMNIWIDEGGTYAGHAPRIKFQASAEQTITREYSSMLLTNPPVIENFPKKSPIKNKDLKKLEKFVIDNLENLLKLSNGEIDYLKDFLPNIIV